MHPETFIWIALELVAVVSVLVLAWTLFHFAAPRGDDDVPPPGLR